VDSLTKNQLNILIQLAHADKHFAVEEREMIYKISRDRAFPEEIVTALIRQPEPIGDLSLMTLEQKTSHLLDCIHLIFIDTRVFESEIIFARGIALNLGFRKEAVDFLIDTAGKKSREELISLVVTQFQNS
jgi:hypothetical protein